MSGSPACELCDDPIPEHREGRFCSDGCRSVAETLPADAPESAAEDAAADGTASAFFAVEGMHSATCEAYLEAVARGVDGVVDADASYVTESVRVDCEGDPPIDRLTEALSGLGYDATPREERTPEEREAADSVVEGALGYRYAAGVVFASFLLIPYTVVFYPSHLASLLGATDPLAGEGNVAMVLPVFLVLTLVVIFVTGAPVLRDAYIALKLRTPNTGLLVTLTAFAAYFYATAAFFAGGTHAYYDLAVVAVATVTGATFYESLAKRKAAGALTDLTVSRVAEAARETADGTETVPVSELAPGERVLVPEGERVPVDGTLAEGECTVAEAVVTGESTPVRKRAGDELVGGAVVTAGAAVVSVGEDVQSSVDRLASSVWGFQSATHGDQRRANRIAERVTLPLLALSLLAGVGALALGGGAAGAVVAALTVPLAASPWALGVSTPLSAGSSVDRALGRGVAVFDETVFERLRGVETVVFDKTGTLTTGRMEALSADVPDDLLAAAAELERRASHPAAAAIVDAFGDADVPAVEAFTSHATGVEGVVGDRRVLVGNPDLFAERGWEIPEAVRERAVDVRESGHLPVLVGETAAGDGTVDETDDGPGEAAGVVAVGDESRVDWEATLERLGERGLDVVVLTGDDESAAAEFAASPHVDHVFAEVPPAGKAEAVRRLRASGPVAMVGDGTNDAPALAAADLGVSLGSGTALAAEASDLAVVDDDLGGVAAAFDLSAESYRRRRWNDRAALLYNGLAIPLALAGLLNPLFTMAAAVVCCSLVAANAFRESGVA
ncbi:MULTISPECIES: heavy metal translocating P-type ATPase [Halolamina]|uniref:ATPase, P-type (Transporting), HAD superfamily, subfamily IC/heavy metal translocating P-type ATPase n=1 Tax=Halolamina pelagica TaxID=699431 RepID=A0A1I5MSK1_9EURY|nr:MULTISPECIES: heavy metal translocating P-type ATPase [Halolamina]NHX36141.1 cation-translocating P-type ATPase [Halolamina sp. R1-12]SFP12489.1 ATPase, P-type (transporting), HAD superfamily, subfamily IC/heavy metal translocating P-type ATPase [Halolamina pelagica]